MTCLGLRRLATVDLAATVLAMSPARAQWLSSIGSNFGYSPKLPLRVFTADGVESAP